jgi:hypothetical protein
MCPKSRPGGDNKLLIFNALEANSARFIDFLVIQFGARLFCEKQFPQGFHSKAGLATLCKPLKKEPFSSQNWCFFGCRGRVTLVQTGPSTVRWLAVLVRVVRVGKKVLAKTPKRRALRFPQCETARESTTRWDKPRAQAKQEANRSKTRCTTG